MKFKSKIGDWLLLAGAVITIVISIVLWIFIMTNDQRFSQLNQTNSSTHEQTKGRNNKDLYDLYIPTSSFGYNNGKLYRLYDSKNNLSLEFSKEAKDMKVDKIKLESKSQSKYNQQLHNQNFIQLTYPDEITFSLFADLSSKKDNRQFNRIFIPNEGNSFIYVGNDKTQSLFKLNVRKVSFDRLRKYAQSAHSKIPVTFVRLRSGYTPFYDEAHDWQIYSYLVNKQSDSYFVTRLLGNSGVSTKTNKKGQTTYSQNYYTRLVVPHSSSQNNEYNYTHYEKNHYQSMTDKLLDSVYYVHRLGLVEQDLRFFDADNTSVKYTNYVEGTPVFLNKNDVQVNADLSSDAVTINFNSTNLQIPIPFDGQTKTLEATHDLIEKLKNHGLDENQIEGIVVGSKVENDKSKDNLVNLIPTYYIKAFGEWKSVDDWMNQDMSVFKDNNRNKPEVNN